jgi:peptidoglycan hydrolase CwlO-like protein
MKTVLKRVYEWLSDHVVVVLSAISVAAVVLFALFKRKDILPPVDFEKPNGISEDLQEAEHLKGYKEALQEQIIEVEGSLKETDANISEVDQEIVKTNKEIESMDFDQKLDKFEELGY